MSNSNVVTIDARPPSTTAFDSLLESAASGSLDVQSLTSLIDLRNQERHEQARHAFNVALANLQSEMPDIPRKGKTSYRNNKGFQVSYNWARYDDIVSTVRPLLSKHQINITFRQKQESGWLTVKCILTHAFGHSEDCQMSAPYDASGSKNPVQEIASTRTYLMRYLVAGMLGVATEDDNDGEGSNPPPKAPAQQKAAAPAQLNHTSSIYEIFKSNGLDRRALEAKKSYAGDNWIHAAYLCFAGHFKGKKENDKTKASKARFEQYVFDNKLHAPNKGALYEVYIAHEHGYIFNKRDSKAISDLLIGL